MSNHLTDDVSTDDFSGDFASDVVASFKTDVDEYNDDHYSDELGRIAAGIQALVEAESLIPEAKFYVKINEKKIRFLLNKLGLTKKQFLKLLNTRDFGFRIDGKKVAGMLSKAAQEEKLAIRRAERAKGLE